MDELYTQAEVAEATKMSIAWMERKRWEGGGIPFVLMGKRAVRYRAVDVNDYIASKMRRSTSE